MAKELLDKQMMDKAANREARVYVRNIANLKLGLSSAISQVAGKCYSAGLIKGAVFEIMFQGEWNSDHDRAQNFLHFVHKKLEQYKKTDPEAVKRTITTLAAIVRKDGAISLEQMATKIDGCSNPEEFRCITSDVSQGIQTALDSIATEAFSKDIITSSEYQACIDGSATAENRRIKFLFTAIYEAINLDPKNLGRFLDVLKDMREPIITQNCHDPIKKMLEKDEGIDDC